MAHHMQSGKQHKVWKKCKSSFCWHVYDKIRTYKMIKQQNEICKREIIEFRKQIKTVLVRIQSGARNHTSYFNQGS